jgi:predicted DNA-binding transcriptional regulator YafY
MKDAIGTLPREVMRFIQERIDSVPELEALLMMSEDLRAWSAAEISRRVYVSPEKAAAILEALVRQKLVAPGAAAGVFEFRPTDEQERDLIAAVMLSYRKNLSLIATLIHEKASGSIREFARAFDLKKDH